MIRDAEKLNRFYRSLIKEENIPLVEVMKLYDCLHAEAVSLGAIRSETIMDGIEVDIRIARALDKLASGAS